MRYCSTRDTEQKNVCTSAQAIKQGLASDGGLFVPLELPVLTEEFLQSLAGASYDVRAAKILKLFLDDYTEKELLEDCAAAYREQSFPGGAAPLVKVDDFSHTYSLELWHGPTAAFKDMALQIMPRLLSRALQKTGEDRTALILVATSGDTGKAALEGYRDVEGTKIQVFYPIEGVSQVQKKQMQTQEGKNVSVIGIKGNFDDAQTGVKRIFSSEEIASELNAGGVFLSSANSINWGRLVPQIVYYISAYCDMYKMGEITLGEPIDVCVPTGNFGNIFACYIAKRMGLPVGKLVCASNKNNILTDCLSEGVYDRNREFYATMSPSMDILISSNLERLLYLLFGSERCSTLMKELGECGRYELTADELARLREDFVGYYTDEDDCAATISRCYKQENRLIDTHTSVALSAAQRYMSLGEATSAMLVVSTASAYKFAGDVMLSLTGEKPEDDLLAPALLREYSGVEIPLPLENALSKEAVHKVVIDREKMVDSVRDFALR